MYAKRSSFGSRAVHAVEEFFKRDKFVNAPTRIARYAQWAVRGDGPALWRVPTPRDCECDPKSDRYIVRCYALTTARTTDLENYICVCWHCQDPIDVFESEFIVKTFAPFVKACKGSCADYGHLVGALAMSAAAVSGASNHDCND